MTGFATTTWLNIGKSVRTIVDNRYYNGRKLLFVADDIKKLLGLTNNELKDLVEERSYSDGTFQVIDEPALYRLMLLSKKKVARKFQAWVFEHVLPSIRKTGEYNQFLTPTNQEG